MRVPILIFNGQKKVFVSLAVAMKRKVNQSKTVIANTNKKAVSSNNNPLVAFYYNGDDYNRYVRVIGVNYKYLIGLEVTVETGGVQKYAFKKFLKYKIDNFRLLEYNPMSVK